MNAIAVTRQLPLRLPRLEMPALMLAALLMTPACGTAADACPLRADVEASATAAMPTDCPLHAAHMSAGDQAAAHRHEIDARGDVAMGFSQAATEHHFRLADDGGSIEVTARDAADTTTITSVRSHLQHIAVAFGEGDFTIPTAVHAQLPPGAAAMREAGQAVRYRYEELPAGARVVIAASTPSALTAVHDFLRFQIADHGTGDPAGPAGG
jgi:hypothetical protein